MNMSRKYRERTYRKVQHEQSGVWFLVDADKKISMTINEFINMTGITHVQMDEVLSETKVSTIMVNIENENTTLGIDTASIGRMIEYFAEKNNTRAIFWDDKFHNRSVRAVISVAIGLRGNAAKRKFLMLKRKENKVAPQASKNDDVLSDGTLAGIIENAAKRIEEISKTRKNNGAEITNKDRFGAFDKLNVLEEISIGSINPFKSTY
jgi:hypothetical protein